jgi:exosortase
MTVATPIERSGLLAYARRHPLLALALLLTVVPTLIATAQQSWSQESGVHGPLVLATAIWLVWRNWDEVVAEARPGNLWLAVPAVVLMSAVYAFGRAFNFLLIEVGALIVALLAIAYAFAGHRVMMKMWFPIVYLLFLVPLPGWLMDSITQPLKLLVSDITTWILSGLGYPIAQVGVTLYIAQYQLLVEDACAGLNSLISLTAVGLFYIYLMHNASWRYSLLLLALLLPVAIAANVVRVIILVLLTYYAGNEVAQSYLHDFAGIVTFVSALLLIFLLDKLLTPVRRYLGAEPRVPHAPAA